MKTLFLSSWNPYPPDVGGRARALSLLNAIADGAGGEVELVTFAESAEEAARAREHLEGRGIGCTIVAHPIEGASLLARASRRHLAVLRGIPYNAQICRHPLVERAVREKLRHGGHDLIVAETSWMGQYVEPSARGRKVLSWQNVDFDGFRKRARAERNPLRRLVHLYNHRMARRFELRLLERFDALLTVSEADRRLLLDTAPVKTAVHVLPLSVDTDACRFRLPREDGGQGLLFVGAMFYQPNIDAVTYFHAHVYGRVRRSFPEAHLTVVGKRPAPALLRLARRDASVRVTGTVGDVGPHYREAAVLVAPIRYGGGMKTKVLEAMAFGVPVVGSSSALEGIDARDGQHVFVRDSAEGFAEAVVLLLSDPARRRAMALEARRLVEEQHSQPALTGRLRGLLGAMGVARSPAS